MASSQRRKRSALDRALFHMKPNRVAARFASGGRHQTWTAIVKSPFKAKTIHTPKSGRLAYQQRMARERKQRAAAVAKQRKQATADQKASRAQMRKQQPKPPRPRQQPIAVNPRTGKPITWREAQAGIRQAERELRRIDAQLAGKKPGPARKRAARTAQAPNTPLARAIEDVKKARKQPVKKAAAKKPARRPMKPKAARKRIVPLAPILAGSTPPQVRRPGRNLTGVAMAISCECQGTGRIIVYGQDGNPHGSTTCPAHGRGGDRRGAKRWTTKRALRDSGLPGLSAWLIKRRTKKRGNSDARQSAAFDRARRFPRFAGPTLECEWCEGGIVERRLTEDLRRTHMSDARVEAARLVLAAQKHNERAAAEGGKPMKVPKVPDEKSLERAARLAFPHGLCSKCGGLGVRETSIRLMRDGQQPVAEWRATAGLKDGHRSTARQRSTGRRQTENAVAVERRRRLPRL